MFEAELPLLRPLGDQIGWNLDDSKIVQHIHAAFTLSETTLLWMAIGLIAYAVIELVEAVGLWLMKRWGEYLAVIATSAFLPLEIYELTEKVTTLRVLAVVISIVAVVWLLWSKRLFGLNGGGAAYRAGTPHQSLLRVVRGRLA